MRIDVFAPALRRRHFYKVPQAGAKLGLRRTQSYEAVDAGVIPVERHGKLLLVRKELWDRRVRKLLRSPAPA